MERIKVAQSVEELWACCKAAQWYQMQYLIEHYSGCEVSHAEK
jgi:hypothetical protein